jgi:glycosyltransferase involved in cell wall biosynthesis
LLQKKLISGFQFRRLRRAAKRLLFDLDDAIWVGQQKPHHFITRLRISTRLRRIVEKVDLCIAANQVLGKHVIEKGARAVSFLPMALRASEWIPTPRPAREGGIVGWAGAPGNLPYLERLAPALKEVFARFPSWKLRVYSGEKPKLEGLDYDYVSFQPGTEREAIRSFNIGLLPLPDTEFAAGKSPIKALQYFAAGVATVASPIGATTEIVREPDTGLYARNDAEWVQSISRFISECELRERTAARARSFFEENHSAEHIAAKLAKLFHGR